MATNVSFNGNSLQASNILTDDIDHHGLPDKNAAMYPLAHASKSAIPFVDYPSKTIPLTGTLIGTSIANLDALIDTFKGYLIGTDKNLDIDYNGGTRRYTATVNKLAINRPGGLTYAKYQLEFICSDPFGHDTSATSVLNQSGRTSGSYTDSVTFGGTAPYQAPIITITFSAIAGATNQSLTIGNNNTGQMITVQRTWASTDVLVIDCVNKTVTVNGAAAVFSGAFPVFAPGAGSLVYFDYFTSRTFGITVNNTQGYL